MKHDARSVANEIIRHAQEEEKSVTPLQVKKLVYYCHAWMLGLYGQPLLRQPIEAWQYGPVVRDIYVSLYRYGSNPIEREIDQPDEKYTELETDLISQVWEKYGHLTGFQLSERTHRIGTPWYKVWHRRWHTRWARKPTIPNKLIREYYEWIARSE